MYISEVYLSTLISIKYFNYLKDEDMNICETAVERGTDISERYLNTLISGHCRVIG